MSRNFKDISYLLTGSPAQQQLYAVLEQSRILHILADYGPILAGTFPLDIQVPGSDIDIICQCTTPDCMAAFLKTAFGAFENFHVRYPSHVPAVVAGFRMMGYEVEIFAQDIPAVQQMAYLHLVKEYALLEKHGILFKQKIIALKREGIKTEPAFCRLLNIEGDPYAGLLAYGA